MRNSVDLFRSDTGLFPLALADLAATAAPTNGRNAGGTSTAITAADWRGPYLDSVPTDPFTSTTTWTYGTAASDVGTVKSTATGYTTW